MQRRCCSSGCKITRRRHFLVIAQTGRRLGSLCEELFPVAGKMRGSNVHAIDYAKAAREIVKESRSLTSAGDLDKPTAILAALLCKMDFSEERAVIAAKKGVSILGALRYLKSAEFLECPLCASDVEPEAMVRLAPCGHGACESCCRQHFEVKAREEASIRLVCFTCERDVEMSALVWLLRKLLARKDYELLDKKLLESSLETSPDFRYCTKCGFGFLSHPELKRAQCPQCKVRLCAKCWIEWEDQHEGVSCEDFEKWKKENDPDFQAETMEAIFRDDGVCCPQCKKQFHIARGGCLHFTCATCHFQFCMGCGSEFAAAEKCKAGMEDCARRGLHAHHPRNCFYYVRDLGTADELLAFIKRAIEGDNVQVDERAPENSGAKCRRVVTDESMKDIPCKENAYKAGLCVPHYKEYLADFIFKNAIDPVPLMSVDQLRSELQRNKKVVPEKRPKEEDETYACRLREIVANSIPVEGGQKGHSVCGR